MSIMPMGLDILRDRNQLFRENSEGLIENTYTLKILNKTLNSPDLPAGRGRAAGVPVVRSSRGDPEGGRDLYPAGESGGGSFNLKRPTLDVQFVLKREGAAPDDSKGTLRQPSKFISRL